MDDVTESLPALIRRRQGELRATGLMDLYRRLPAGDDRITYETFRLLANGRQRNIRGDRVFRDLALILAVDENTVRASIGAEPMYGPWELPDRAVRLDPDERNLVVNVIDGLLRAKSMRGEGNVTTTPTENSDAEGTSALEHAVVQQLRAAHGTEIFAVDDHVVELRVHLERDAAERAGIDLAHPDTGVVIDLPGHRPLPADLDDLAADRQKQRPEMERNTDLQHQAEAGEENQD